MRNIILKCVSLCFVASMAHAQPSEDVFAMSLEELVNIEVSIATGTPKALNKAPAAASIITAEELVAMGAQDINDALERVPGLHVARGGLFYAPRYFIRGIASTNNAQTLILVNGIPMTSMVTGDRIGLQQWLPAIATVDRIEIIRGPGSAVYGADAFAGVINIKTKHPDNVHGGHASLSHGSFDTTRAALQQGSTSGPVRALLSLAYERSNGAEEIIAADAQTGIDAQLAPFAIPATSLAPGPANTGAENIEARLDLAWGDFLLHTAVNQVNDQGTGQGLADALDPVGRWGNRLATTDLTWSPDTYGAWELEARLSYLYASIYASQPSQIFPPGFFGAFPDGVLAQAATKEETARLGFTAVYQGWSQHRLRLGSGFDWGDLFQTRELANFDLSTGIPIPLPGGLTDVSDTPAVFQPEAQRTHHHVFVQDEWALAKHWELTYGLRYDHYSDFGNSTNPRLALIWATTPWLTSKLMYGEAFRPPAFFELYAINNPVAQGNPQLAPEKLSSSELAFSITPAAAWTLDINLYRFRIEDFIDFVQDPGGSFTAQNASRIRGRGLETELRYQLLMPVQLLANYSYQHTEDESSGAALGLAPREKIFLRSIWSLQPQWQMCAQLNIIGQRERQAGDAREDLKGYSTLDLTLRRLQASQGFALALIARNLFDADVREPSRGAGPGQTTTSIPHDLPQAGRSLALEVSTRW